MNTVDFIWNGQTLHLLLNGAALFDIFDRYGSDAEILELIAGSEGPGGYLLDPGKAGGAGGTGQEVSGV
jgi:hypothetical protein